ncbi:hypothetical protein ETAE_0822 [Edwardsiella piscicida]|uniref:Uncharacterized protein n=1 Tax=Edwardsiella piscicida TaxID=1263550 RepID=A0AAU8P1Y0_EDWPI|nr:hypothetical protein ETAE_0822 [Edwardsiella tarda EIB202]
MGQDNRDASFAFIVSYIYCGDKKERFTLLSALDGSGWIMK